ncbi:MAG: hypothetical protein ACI90Q_002635, partial [Nonlabens sp.]
MYHNYRLWIAVLLFSLSTVTPLIAQKNKSSWTSIAASQLQSDPLWSR